MCLRRTYGTRAAAARLSSSSSSRTALRRQWPPSMRPSRPCGAPPARWQRRSAAPRSRAGAPPLLRRRHRRRRRLRRRRRPRGRRGGGGWRSPCLLSPSTPLPSPRRRSRRTASRRAVAVEIFLRASGRIIFPSCRASTGEDQDHFADSHAHSAPFLASARGAGGRGVAARGLKTTCRSERAARGAPAGGSARGMKTAARRPLFPSGPDGPGDLPETAASVEDFDVHILQPQPAKVGVAEPPLGGVFVELYHIFLQSGKSLQIVAQSQHRFEKSSNSPLRCARWVQRRQDYHVVCCSSFLSSNSARAVTVCSAHLPPLHARPPDGLREQRPVQIKKESILVSLLAAGPSAQLVESTVRADRMVTAFGATTVNVAAPVQE